MSILTGPAIEMEMAAGRVVVDPAPPWGAGPNSLDLRLGTTMRRYKHPGIINPYHPPPLVDVPFFMHRPWMRRLLGYPNIDRWLLHPGRVYLATTMERTYTPHHVPRLDGRSSTGRLGLFVHVTAGFGDVGFNQRWVVELVAMHPIWVSPGMRLFQLYLDSPEGELRQYAGRYNADNAVSLGLGRELPDTR